MSVMSPTSVYNVSSLRPVSGIKLLISTQVLTVVMTPAHGRFANHDMVAHIPCHYRAYDGYLCS